MKNRPFRLRQKSFYLECKRQPHKRAMLNSVDLEAIPAAAGFIVHLSRTIPHKSELPKLVPSKILPANYIQRQSNTLLTAPAWQNFLRTRSQYLNRR